MTEILDPAHRIYLVIAEIPYGKVASYGQIATLAGLPRAARFVGQTLKKLPAESKLPWHRVINQQGKISLTGQRQLKQHEKLRAEGILFNASGKINLKRYGWQP